MTAEAGWRVELPVFEGPLDLLLHLVRKHELAILDIPIGFITEKYLEHLGLMRQLNLDVAAEYLLMAATLAYIKSREMLPTPDAPLMEEREDGDPRADLIRRLLEYQRFKDAAARLGERPLLGRDVFARGVAPEAADDGDAPLAEVSVFSLIESLGEIMKKARVRLDHEVVIDRVSVVERIHALLDRLEREQSFPLESCLNLDGAEAQLRHDLVVTFLALLEMAKLRLVRLHQISPGGAIYVSRVAGASREAPLSTDYR